MAEPSFRSIHRELFIWFAARSDVVAVQYSDSTITVAPKHRMTEQGSDWPRTVTVRIAEAELRDAWPELTQGARLLELNRNRDLSELGAFSLLSVHLDEAVNSMREPGPNGYAYRDGSFQAA